MENLCLPGIVHRTSNQRTCTVDFPKTNSNILILGCIEEGLSFPPPEENTFLPKTLQQNPSKGHPKLPNLHYLPGK